MRLTVARTCPFSLRTATGSKGWEMACRYSLYKLFSSRSSPSSTGILIALIEVTFALTFQLECLLS